MLNLAVHIVTARSIVLRVPLLGNVLYFYDKPTSALLTIYSVTYCSSVWPTAVTVISVSHIAIEAQLQAVFIIHFCAIICTLIVYRDEDLTCHRHVFLKTNKCD
jgi:cytochrome b561